jgi:hypothetical protein
MNILIENPDTNEYLTRAGLWDHDPRTAQIFGTSRLAVRAARQESVGKFNIVLYIPTTNQFVNLDHGRGKGSVATELD